MMTKAPKGDDGHSTNTKKSIFKNPQRMTTYRYFYGHDEEFYAKYISLSFFQIQMFLNLKILLKNFNKIIKFCTF